MPTSGWGWILAVCGALAALFLINGLFGEKDDNLIVTLWKLVKSLLILAAILFAGFWLIYFSFKLIHVVWQVTR